MTGTLGGKHALVTGGGRGIGAAVATALAQRGCELTLVGRQLEALESHAIALRGTTPVSAIAADVTDEAAVERAFARAALERGPIDILVNNAGAAASRPFAKMDSKLWREMMEVNLNSTYYCTRAAIAGMLAGGWGRIVNVASTAGVAGAPYVSAYCAAKHGVVGLTRALAAEYARGAITVNAVCPGFVETDLFDRAISNVAQRSRNSKEAAREAILERSAQTRSVKPEEVAEAVAWLCSPAAAAVTGQSIVIDASGTA